MNYLMEIKRFYDRQLSQRLSTGQIALWHALMEVNNRCGWQEWFNVRWGTLMEMTDLSEGGVQYCLKALINKGYIEKREKGVYRMIPIKKSEYNSGNNGGFNGGFNGEFNGEFNGNSDMTPIIYNKQNKTKQNKTKYELEEELFDSLSVKL